MEKTKSIYELDKICFSYNRKTVVKELSLDIPEGSICAIMGPNGTGKTTLLHLLLGWLKPESGTIRVSGRPLHSLSPRRRGRTIGLLPQNENLSFDYTVIEYILLGRAPHLHPLQQPASSDHDAARKALTQVNGEDLEQRNIPTLSGGETQTTLMARSLTQDPKILLLDEPANHLDPARRKKILDIIRMLKAADRTVIFTTHTPEDAAGTADFLILMPSDGPVIYGPFNELFTEDNLSRLYGIPVRIIRLTDETVAVTY